MTIDFITLDIGATFWKNLLDLGFQIFPKLLWAGGILLLTRLAVGFVGRFTRRALTPVEPTLRMFLIQAAEFLTLVVGVVSFLNTLGIQATSVVAVVGAAGLAISLALQGTLSHFAAGVMLINLRPFDVGDYIEGASVGGVVDSIGVFSTTLVTKDHVMITVPNGQLFSGTLKNLTALGTRRMDLEIDIGDRPIESTITLFLSLVQPHPLVLDEPKTTCHVLSITPTSTILYVRPWCTVEAYDQARSEILQLIKESLNHPIELPPLDDPGISL